MNNGLKITPSLAALMTEVTERAIELETALLRETARRQDLERMILATTMALAAKGSLTMDDFLAAQNHTVVGHA